ncbi:phenylalanine--tRNA ligase subunit beta [Desulforhopalus vacuolatus]|uniref:phenylalanine--tRNA ligase subunit beta n=1 Tax=Desulforhopalus vacuolatus TaxID=40414 RepID=UPI001963C60F|nr:phenylalanine--tRNA ligase subunit beta [Desulforhopalus vacuolatus]MBM9519835.1 phenylalanine--tRNA ligase subunit beta [Desulforhopalus vacuolatus]
MKFTRNWLKQYVDFGEMPDSELAEYLTMLGLEVDSVTPLFQDLAVLKTGTVVTCDKHPDADKLHVCSVRIGEDTHQIVCGAPNVRTGLKVVAALPGAVLPGDFKIKKSKIRGVASAGMLCSERELGLSNAHDGIMELPEETGDGERFIDVMEMTDTCIEVDLTPNRPDCTAVIGIAREVGSVIGKKVVLPVSGAAITNETKQFEVVIKEPQLCPRYTARLIENVKIGPSPWWLRRLLLSVDLRPINNIVDITNFVMLEYGQPLHAFDFDSLAENKIIVRTPTREEKKFISLDGTERILEDETLMICDAEKPVAIAGVMGGKNSEITENCTRVLLESACFNPVSIRKTARKQKLPTDASYRFERGVDPKGTVNALNRAVELICEFAGGTAADEGLDRFPGQQDPLTISLNVSHSNTLLGLNLTAEEIVNLLESIEISCTIENDDNINTVIPSFRIDLEREADLIEEVARLYGYDNIPVTLPSISMNFPAQDKNRLKRLFISKELTTIGWSEAINYSFIGINKVVQLGIKESDPRINPVRLLSPLSEDLAVLRTTLLPGLLDNVRRNINFQRPAIKLFELGKVFFPKGEDEQPDENIHLAGILSGNRYGDLVSPLYYKAENVDFYDIRGAVEFVLQSLRLPFSSEEKGLHFQVPEPGEPFFQEGQTLDLCLDGKCLGFIGKIDSEVLRNYSIKNEVFYFDLDYDALCRVENTDKQFSSLPVYPAVRRDISLVVPVAVSAGELLKAVQSSKDKLIEDTEIFDVFTGKSIPKGFKSISLKITYRSATKTLTEKNVEKAHAKVLKMLTDRFGGSLRDA